MKVNCCPLDGGFVVDSLDEAEFVSEVGDYAVVELIDGEIL